MNKFKQVLATTTLSLLLVPSIHALPLNAEEVTTSVQERASQAGRTQEQLKASADTNQEPTKVRSNASALETAKSYQTWAHMSKAALYDQLIYEGYKSSEAQYAVDHVGSDWNQMAYLTAKSYMDIQCVGGYCDYWSKAGLHDQLSSEYGEQFTSSQADFAVNKLNYDWKANALKQGKIYKAEGKNAKDTRSRLVYDKFTTSEIDYAMNNLFPETWSNSGSVKKYVSGKAHGKNATYIEDYKQTQTSSNGRTRTIRVDYKKGTYDASGHTKTWENWDYDKNGKYTQKAITSYAYISGKEREINYTKYKYKSAGVGSSAVHTAYKNTKYFSNGRVKSTSTYSYYANSNQASKNVWNEFYSNGKKKDCKDTYYYTNGKKKSTNQNLYYSTDGKKDKHIWNSFYDNGKMKTAQDHYYYSNGSTVKEMHMNSYNSKGQKTKNVLNTFYDNGKKKLCQDKYYYTNGKTKSIAKNTYSSTGKRTSHYNKNY